MKIQDISRLAGVSVATVSRVLNNTGSVKASTRERILKIIEENHYTPSAIARNLVKKDNNTIGIVLPDIKNLYFASMMNEIIIEANKQKINVVVSCSNESFEAQKKCIDIFINQRVKGIIVVVTQNSCDHTEYFEDIKKRIPIVFLDRKICDESDGVFLDNFGSVYKYIDKLVKEGKKNIGFLAGPLTISSAKERLLGYKQALEDNNVEIVEDNILFGEFTFESGYELGKKMYGKPLDAIYISNNSMTLGYLKALKEKQVDYSNLTIVTFETNEIIKFLDGNILSNEIPFQTLAKSSIDMVNRIVETKGYNKKIEIVEID